MRSRIAAVSAAVALIAIGLPLGASEATASVVPTSATFTAPTVVLPSTPVSVAISLGNNSRVDPGVASVTFDIACYNTWPITRVTAPPVPVKIAPDPKNPPGSDTLAVASAALAVPSSCGPTNSANHGADGYFTATISQVGLAALTQVSPFWIGKPFTASNFRQNLVIKTGKDDVNYQAHHELPQKYRETFSQAGFNIDDPQYGLWWCSKTGVATNHQSQAAAYNSRWDSFFGSSPGASKAAITSFLASILKLYTYTC